MGRGMVDVGMLLARGERIEEPIFKIAWQETDCFLAILRQWQCLVRMGVNFPGKSTHDAWNAHKDPDSITPFCSLGTNSPTIKH